MTHERDRAIKKDGRKNLVQCVPAISELRPGLTMVVGLYSEMSHYVYAVIVKELATRSTSLPIPMPECETISCFHSGPPRKLEQLKGAHKTLGISALESEKFKSVYRVASASFDWTNTAAVSSLLQKRELKNGGCFVLQQPDGTVPNFPGMLDLDRAGQKSKSRIFLFSPGLAHDGTYCSVASELFVVSPCDSNPGFDEAFVLTCPELASPVNPASGKVLCCFRLGDDGLETEITPYVADDIKTRLMAILKADGWSLGKIGKTINLDKSNVSRKLRNLTSTVPEGWDDDMLREWLEACDLGPIDDQDDIDGSKADHDDDDSDKWDDDLDSLDAPKTVAPANRNGRNTRNKSAVANRKQR